jgi:hypothetical protein
MVERYFDGCLGTAPKDDSPAKMEQSL